ncbi:MAG: hypothetical protein H8K06_17110 [Nitrospira sp.]|uniref:Uncharacterized protein n=1 Tax=Nitrospira defluvii TaxID=330214 RepID=A0ABN7L389_9BACT|nr:hypothetical protein [Nitrospira defluvii]MCS6328787.1 hypothetical protein [Nitrospira sp.]CAE6728414.1 hypothetical protein NSPZN2_100228 [Nitrospira defluvii]
MGNEQERGHLDHSWRETTDSIQFLRNGRIPWYRPDCIGDRRQGPIVQGYTYVQARTYVKYLHLFGIGTR